MENIEKYFKFCFIGIGTGLTWVLGAWDTAMVVLITLMCLDYLTGVLRAIIKKELSSNVGYKGIAKKGGILIVLILGVSLDRLLSDGAWVFRTLVAYFYIANEGISLLENLGAIGVPIPPKILEVLIQIKKNSEVEEVEK